MNPNKTHRLVVGATVGVFAACALALSPAVATNATTVPSSAKPAALATVGGSESFEGYTVMNDYVRTLIYWHNNPQWGLGSEPAAVQ
jgi:hypothetical protein